MIDSAHSFEVLESSLPVDQTLPARRLERAGARRGSRLTFPDASHDTPGTRAQYALLRMIHAVADFRATGEVPS